MEKPENNVAVKIEILDRTGKVIRTIRNIPKDAGINRIIWDLRLEGPRPRREERREEDFFFRGPRGPQVLPGTYTAKLTLGENIYNTSFEVRVDPTVSVSLDQLKIQQLYSLQLRDMQSFVNDGLRALDILKKQIEERRDILNTQAKDVPKEVTDAIETHSNKIEALMNILTTPEGRAFWSEGPRLGGRLSRLFGSIDGVHAPPTQAQIDYFRELKEEFDSAIKEVNDYLNQSAKDLNKTFKKFQVPLLILPDPIKITEK
jgi:hypothetical protein